MSIRAAQPDTGSFGPVESSLDHLVYAVPDLAAATQAFAAATGVTPAEGGRHLRHGTRNVLVGFGATSYLEIIGPDSDNPADPGVAMPFGLHTLGRPRLVTWAVHPADLEVAAAASAAAGADLGKIWPLSRRTPAWRPAGVATRIGAPGAAGRRHPFPHRLGHDPASRARTAPAGAARPARQPSRSGRRVGGAERTGCPAHRRTGFAGARRAAGNAARARRPDLTVVRRPPDRCHLTPRSPATAARWATRWEAMSAASGPAPSIRVDLRRRRNGRPIT